MTAPRRSTLLTFVVLALLLVSSIALQIEYDATHVRVQTFDRPYSAAFIRTFDLGLHSALASSLWLGVIRELPFFDQGPGHFFDGLEAVVGLDPRFSFPYAYTTIVLPIATQYPERIDKAIEIGRRGVAFADPDWRIPFYLAAAYQLDRLDIPNAIHFYEQAARTPGVPDVIKKFSENFGISKKLRQETLAVWVTIYQSTDDELLRERAKKNVERLYLFDQLETLAGEYKNRFGVFPKTPDDFVARGFVASIPLDPFGLPIYFTADGYVSLNQQSY